MLNRRQFSVSLGATTLALATTRVHGRNIGDTIALPSVTTIDGKTLGADAWRGKVLIVERFATWCPFCKIMNPKIEKLLQTNRARGLAVLALSIDRNAADVPKYLQQHRYSFYAAMWNADWERALGDRRGLPVFWIIGRDGRLKQVESGELLDEDVAEFARWL